MSKKILLVEDQQEIAEGIIDFLGKKNYELLWCNNGIDGLKYIRSQSFDLIVLDIVLPGRSGIEILQALREEKREVPVLMLTAKSSVDDIIAGLGRGADGYLPKPFNMREFKARVDALLKRPPQTSNQYLVVGELCIDLDARKVYRRGQEVHLRRKEYDILRYLAAHPNRTLSKDQILSAVWIGEDEPASQAVDVHISNIRRKLILEPGDETLIYTVHGVGFELKA